MIEAGGRQGLFKVSDPKLAAMAVFDMVNGMFQWFRPRDAGDAERIAAAYVKGAVALLRGWEGRGGSAPSLT